MAGNNGFEQAYRTKCDGDLKPLALPDYLGPLVSHFFTFGLTQLLRTYALTGWAYSLNSWRGLHVL
ncbi:uncharacterized protein FOMMEDRAFT_138204 [Fomitiporia mediterranea MF3/22]|uniref:uncharacterized protein n=1 Tax=Fomitiporia mediterranea (strain MF3/22) TaxID=694068 RepID=UPI000440736D|nr:uncharacterized protein FOMMEDRAFT_138204 [Fomitiporia mediterranea MF3/22]EJD08311.1 hypothetical protein FOMMEDRAFT_138204 [Fomitiporia mediterranea MF3/22]